MKTKIMPIILGIVLIVNLLSIVSAVSITNVMSTPDEIAPGQIADVSIEVENIFDYDVTNIRLKLDLTASPFAPYQSSSEKFLDELDDGDEDEFKFRLIVLPDTASGIYKIPTQITYTDVNGTNVSKSDTISLIVNSKPELKISLEDSITIKGKENKISVRIVNSGLADVKFVYVILNDASGIRVLNENEQYIGDINSDDFDSIDYNIFVNTGTSNSMSLPVTIKYRDATNKEFTETKTIELKSYSLKEAQSLGLVAKPSYKYYIIVVILIVFYVIYRIRKSIKKKKKIEGGR